MHSTKISKLKMSFEVVKPTVVIRLYSPEYAVLLSISVVPKCGSKMECAIGTVLIGLVNQSSKLATSTPHSNDC